MQPILVIAALAVGAGLLSTGFLANNTIQLWTQDTGFGEQDIKSPFDHANIDFNVTKVLVEGDSATPLDDYYKNVITECSFHTFEEVDDGTEIICKLQAWSVDGKSQVVVCEGRDLLVNYKASTIGYIGDLTEAYEGACAVSNIDGVQIVAQGERPFSAACPDQEDGSSGLIVDNNKNGMYEPWGLDVDENGIPQPGNPNEPGDDDYCATSTLNTWPGP
jgi:hypothetical protein